MRNLVEEIPGVRMRSPFTKKVIEFVMLPRFKMPVIEPYERNMDPQEHLESYLILMQLHEAPDPI